MIPPFLFSLGGKIGMGLLGAAVIAGAIYAYNARQQSIGYSEREQEYQKQVQEQTARVEVHESAQDLSRLEGLERLIAEKDKFNKAMLRENQQLKAKLSNTKPREVMHDIQYVEVPKELPCVVPDGIVDRVDYLASVLNAIPYHRVPGSAEALGSPVVPGLAPVACAALVDRIEVLTQRLGNSLISHRSLSERVMEDYEAFQVWKKGAPK